MIAWLLGLQLAGATQVLDNPLPEDPTAPLRLAVVIGLDGKIGTSFFLTAPERDATALGQALHEAGWHRVTVLTGEETATESLVELFEGLAREGLGPDDTLLVSVISHGTVCRATGDGRTQHLRVWDTDVGDKCWTNAVRDEDLLGWLRATEAGRRVLMIDACQSYFGSQSGGAAPRREHLDVVRDQELVLRSTGMGRDSFEIGGRAIYTWFVTRGFETGEADLDGDGAVTAGEAHDYAIQGIAHEEVDMTPTRSEFVVGDPPEVVLAGTPGERTRVVFEDLPRGGYRVGRAGDPVPMGGRGSLVVAADGPLLHKLPGRVAGLRVFGVPEDPVAVPSGPWVAGRQRGTPSLIVEGGAVGHAGLDGLPLTAPGPALLAVRVHQQLLPELALSAELLRGPDLGWEGLVLAPELHWRRVTLSAGARAGWLHLAGTSAVVQDKAGPSLGLEGGVRVGLVGGIAATLTSTHDFGWAADDEQTWRFRTSALRLGLLWDPGAT